MSVLTYSLLQVLRHKKSQNHNSKPLKPHFFQKFYVIGLFYYPRFVISAIKSVENCYEHAVENLVLTSAIEVKEKDYFRPDVDV